MRLLLFSDLHCNAAAARQIVARSGGCDVIIGAGDFATARRGLQPIIDILRASNAPGILVPGNSESVEELRQACRDWPNANVLHGSGVTIGGVQFFGLGGGVPVTPFGAWSYDFTDAQATELLRACPPGAVLVTHSPPKGCLDVSSAGQSLGSTAIRAAMDSCKPPLLVCGHIHACAGRQMVVGPTTVINAGPAGITWVLTQVI